MDEEWLSYFGIGKHKQRGRYMKGKNKVTLIASIIGAVATISVGFIGGSSYGQQKLQKNFQNSFEKITGDNNTVNINNVDGFIKDYQNLMTSNDRYAKQLEDATKELEELKAQMGETPIFKFKNLRLTIDGEEIPLNSTNSMAIIDGREYLDKSFVDNLLGSDRSLTIKEDEAFVGKIIQDKTDLINEHIVDSDSVNIPDSITDSYGNMYVNAMEFYEDSYIIFNLKEEYTLLKCGFSIKENAYSDVTGRIVIKADDRVVYTSPALGKTIKPFIKTDIAIKNCSLLTIEYHAESYGHGIVSNAVIYN